MILRALLFLARIALVGWIAYLIFQLWLVILEPMTFWRFVGGLMLSASFLFLARLPWSWMAPMESVPKKVGEV